MPAEQVTVAGATLAVQTFGDQGCPALLLIAGAAAPMVSWPVDFCTALAGAGRFVVRYDHRDTGQSMSYPRGAPPYDIATLAADATGVLDVLGVSRAHLAGMSLGGQLAQLVALGQPDRVASLTLVASSPAPLGRAGTDLPRPALSTLCDFDDVEPPDWADAASVVDHLLALARVRAGGGSFDESGARGLAAATVAHSRDVATAMTNHGLLDHGQPWRARLAGLAVPTLVVHGDSDPLFPPAHGRALRDEIPGARLLVLPRTGHDLTGAGWNMLLEAIRQHTGAAATAES